MCVSTLRRRITVALAALLMTSASMAGGVAVVGAELRDNGDDDGFPDTRETVNLRLTVRNTTPLDLKAVVLQLSSEAAEVACISRPRVSVGDLAPGETKTTVDAFVFTMADVDRTSQGIGPLDDWLAAFTVTAIASLGEVATQPADLVLNLDVDLSGGETPTSFFESFESGVLDTFEIQNLDAGLDSNLAADGYRCQVSDPDWVNSNAYAGGVQFCFPGRSSPGAGDATHWQIDEPDGSTGWEGRGYSGVRSLYYGVPLDPMRGTTTPLGVLEAAGTTQPINLDWGRVCSHDPAIRCVDDSGCAGNERCIDVEPVLSFKHQIALYLRAPDRARDRAVVEGQVVDELGLPVGDWIKLEPWLNPYNKTQYLGDFVCSFDPVDDGNTEDDFFDPTDPDRRFGPSSTCSGTNVFADSGETALPFDPANLGSAEGPGLEGESGVGTWVESGFSLRQFEGRRIRVRFLATSIDGGGLATWEDAFDHNPSPDDDGWWIDDVEVTGALGVPATVVADLAPNTALPGFADGDGDGAIDACDTCPGAPDVGQLDRDGDGVGDLCDTCLEVPDPAQTDSDADGFGDACDVCPFGDDDDTDSDGLICLVDNCPLVANVDQTDTDADLLGDACDPCPSDASNDFADPDADGTYCGADNCPTRYNPDGNDNVRLSGILQAAGPVRWFELGPDGRSVVYFIPGGAADDRLYSVEPVRLSPALLASRPQLSGFFASGPFPQITQTPDGAYVVFVGGAGEFPNNDRLFSVPLAGGEEVPLGLPPDQIAHVDDFRVAADGSRVVYRALPRDQPSYQRMLFSVQTVGGASVELNGPIEPYGVVHSFELTPDGSTVVFSAQLSSNIELYRVPIAGGTRTKLNPTLTAGGNISLFEITPDGAGVVYIADQETDELDELYVVPLHGGPATKLSGSPGLPGTGVNSFRISSDGSRVVYRADQETPGVSELYSAPISGGAQTKLNVTPTTGGRVSPLFEITPDGSTVVFIADLETDEVDELYSVPVVGGALTKLNSPLPQGFETVDFVLSPASSHLVYRAAEAAGGSLREAFIVPVGGGSPDQLEGYASPSFVGNPDIVFESRGTHVAYAASDGLWLKTVDGGAARKLNEGWADGAVGSPKFSPDGRQVIYTADGELVAVDLSPDIDGDGILGSCDGCPDVADPDQADEDGDGYGDVCDPCPGDPVNDPDGDDVCGLQDSCPQLANFDQLDSDGDDSGNGCDNCVFTSNIDQSDGDGDGSGDACDCAPADPTARPTVEVAGVSADQPLAGVARFSWPPTPAADEYAVSRASLAEIRSGSFGDCVVPTQATTIHEDGETPGSGEGFAYLIQGVDSVCGLGTAGAGQAGVERSNTDPDACQ